VDTPSKKLEKLIRKNAIGARIEPGIPHVPGIGITPHKNRISGGSDVLRTPWSCKYSWGFTIENCHATTSWGILLICLPHHWRPALRQTHFSVGDFHISGVPGSQKVSNSRKLELYIFIKPQNVLWSAGYGINRALKSAQLGSIGGQISCRIGWSRWKVKERPVLGVKSEISLVGYRRENGGLMDVFCQPAHRRPHRTPSSCYPPLRDRLPIFQVKILFFRPPKKNDLANDPLQGRSPLKQANPPAKTKRALKGLGDPRFSSPIQPYFGKRGEIKALIFTFRNWTVS
jgi:hypothetical protein